MDIERLLTVIDRTRKGPICSSKEWDTKVIPKKVMQKLKEYDLLKTCDPENPINADDELADRYYKAGFELAIDLGLLCSDTERIVNVSREELTYALKHAPSELTVGKGQEQIVLKSRIPEDTTRPRCGAILGTPISEDIWVKVIQAIVQNREIDYVEGGSLISILGRPVIADTPYETLVGRYEAQLLNEALYRAGRLGMYRLGVVSSTTVFGQLGGYGMSGGDDPDLTTALVLPPFGMKTSYTSLHKVAHTLNSGGFKILAAGGSIIGGYEGPPEGAAVGQIAFNLLNIAIHQVTMPAAETVDPRYGGNCGREGQWVTSIVSQAINRNTHLLKETIIDQVGGPCTEMLLYESAVAMMNVAVSGDTSTHVARSAGGTHADYITPLECKFCAEVLKSSAGMTRKQANEITKQLLPKYEEYLYNPPIGQSFRECYNLDTLQPNQEWLEIYNKVKRELVDLGVPLEL